MHERQNEISLLEKAVIEGSVQEMIKEIITQMTITLNLNKFLDSSINCNF